MKVIISSFLVYYFFQKILIIEVRKGGNRMEILKVYNNNIVQVSDETGKELIVMGKGLGFQKKVGQEIDHELIEKRFVLEKDASQGQLDLASLALSADEMELIQSLITRAEEVLNEKFDLSLYIALGDHLHYALTRLREGLVLQNPLTWEVRKFYLKEYQLGLEALDLIKAKFQLDVPEDEAASIALHFVNAQKNVDQFSSHKGLTKLVQQLLDIVRLYYGQITDENSVSYHRFVTHVNYFAQRVLSNMEEGQNDEFLYEQVQHNYPEAFACSQRIKIFVEQAYDFKMSKDEQVYLTIHLQRLEKK